MKRTFTPLLLACAFTISACGGDSNLPEATGKASIRAINAIPTASEIAFLIEERSIGSIDYKATSSRSEYDDLEYNFNFDALYVGETENTRIVSQRLDVVADMDYTFVLMGSVAAPTLTLFETSERDFAETDTVYQARFLHTAEVFGAVDVYFALDGVAPVLGEAIASLSPGEMSDPVDFPEGDYVLTLTAVGDPTTVLYTSSSATVAARNDLIITMFDGDVDDSAPLVVFASGSAGFVFNLRDPSFLPTVDFLHASFDLGAVDVYDDEALTSQIAANLSFKQLTPPQAVATGETTYRYTPTGDTTMVAIERVQAVAGSTRYRLVAVGEAGSYSVAPLILDNRPIETAVKLVLFQATSNAPLLDYYIIDAGETIDGDLPFRIQIATGQQNAAAGLAPGSYDLFATTTGTTDVVGGPLRLDVGLGDVVEVVAYDNADTAIVDLELLATP